MRAGLNWLVEGELCRRCARIMPHVSSVTSMSKASGSVEGSGALSPEGVAAGVRPRAGSGETPARGVEPGVFAVWELLVLDVLDMAGMSWYGESSTTVRRVKNRLTCVGQVISKTHVSSSSLSKAPAFAIHTRHCTLRDWRSSMVVCHISLAISPNTRVPR